MARSLGDNGMELYEVCSIYAQGANRKKKLSGRAGMLKLEFVKKAQELMLFIQEIGIFVDPPSWKTVTKVAVLLPSQPVSPEIETRARELKKIVEKMDELLSQQQT